MAAPAPGWPPRSSGSWAADVTEATAPDDAASPGLLSQEEAISYWDRRHQREDQLRSGGDIGLDRATNEIFYAIRVGKLLEVIGDSNDERAPLFVLDAGCGKGWFSEYLARCGHRVLGIDSSPAAIAEARTSGEARYDVSTLSGFLSPDPFDVVYALDVLFHIVDDGEWERSLHAIADVVQLGGTLVTTDLSVDERDVRGDYIVHRALHEYLGRLEPWGFAYRAFHPYDFRQNRIGFHVFQRVR